MVVAFGLVVAVGGFGGGGGGCFAYCFRVRFWVFLVLGFTHLFGLGFLCFVGLGCVFIDVLRFFRPIGVVWAMPIGCFNFWLDLLLLDVPVSEFL